MKPIPPKLEVATLEDGLVGEGEEMKTLYVVEYEGSKSIGHVN